MFCDSPFLVEKIFELKACALWSPFEALSGTVSGKGVGAGGRSVGVGLSKGPFQSIQLHVLPLILRGSANH